jgi:hypothetical protein
MALSCRSLSWSKAESYDAQKRNTKRLPARTQRSATAPAMANVYEDAGNLLHTSIIDAVVVGNDKKALAMFESISLPSGTDLSSVLTVEGNRIRGHQ